MTKTQLAMLVTEVLITLQSERYLLSKETFDALQLALLDASEELISPIAPDTVELLVKSDFFIERIQALKSNVRFQEAEIKRLESRLQEIYEVAT